MTCNQIELLEDIAIDINDQHIKTYINFKLLHLETFKKEINNIKSFLVKENVPDDYRKFLYELYRYEKKHQYKYTKEKGYKTVAAIRIEILLPRKIKKLSDQKKFAKQYMKECNPIHYDIPWISYIVQRNESNYIVFVISEREYLDCRVADIYNRNYKSKTGAIIHSKGDPKLDQNGKVIKKHVLFSSKVRIFTFSKFKCFELFMQDLTEKLVMVLKPLIGSLQKRFVLKKRNAKKIWHFYNGKCVIEVNHVKRYVETMCNYAYTLQRAKVANNAYEEARMRNSPTPLFKEISNLFYKYKKRFDKQNYHDQTNQLREIAYINVPLDQLQANLYQLKKEFIRELEMIVPQALK